MESEFADLPDRADDRRFDVGILAAIAIPAYQDYTVKAKVSEGLAAARPRSW